VKVAALGTRGLQQSVEKLDVGVAHRFDSLWKNAVSKPF
jgi:hypothetical protein